MTNCDSEPEGPAEDAVAQAAARYWRLWIANWTPPFEEDHPPTPNPNAFTPDSARERQATSHPSSRPMSGERTAARERRRDAAAPIRANRTDDRDRRDVS